MQTGSEFLHIGVVWPPKSFRRYPHDVLRWVFDVAGFAMHTVLGIDLEAWTGFFFHNLVDARGAVALGGFIVKRQISGNRYFRVDQREVARLILLVVGV